MYGELAKVADNRKIKGRCHEILVIGITDITETVNVCLSERLCLMQPVEFAMFSYFSSF